MWDALFDIQVGHNDRHSKQISHCIAPDEAIVYNTCLYGVTHDDGLYTYFCIPLPMSIVGTLSEKSFPLGALATNLVLELDVADLNKLLPLSYPKQTK